MKVVLILFIVDLARTSPVACRFKGIRLSNLADFFTNEIRVTRSVKIFQAAMDLASQENPINNIF